MDGGWATRGSGWGRGVGSGVYGIYLHSDQLGAGNGRYGGQNNYRTALAPGPPGAVRISLGLLPPSTWLSTEKPNIQFIDNHMFTSINNAVN